jgi:ergothioneine biosynthesis protein EgtB
LLSRYRSVRSCTEALAAPLSPEDQQVQTMPDVSPTKWHLAHVTWFFETFILKERLAGYTPFDPAYEFLFNSYYEAVGPRHARPNRGFLSRPSADDVMAYRRHVDDAMTDLLASADADMEMRLEPLVTLGLNHEQQHQELLLMDIKHVFSCNPLYPAYDTVVRESVGDTAATGWIEVDGGIRKIGHAGVGFAFDNEGPQHEVLLRDFRIGSRLVTNGEYRAFIEDDGYSRPEYWFMDGIETARREGWNAPAYWREIDGEWFEFTLSGLRPLDPSEPVSHVSYYEAAAYAAWAGHRLATEAEWECAAEALPANIEDGANLMNADRLHPAVAASGDDRERPRQMIGDLWEWTQSPYSNYPGFRPAAGAIGEYNGKFMANQIVLRGGCCATPEGHIRTTYRNFFYPHQRWMFSGIRLAADA